MSFICIDPPLISRLYLQVTLSRLLSSTKTNVSKINTIDFRLIFCFFPFFFFRNSVMFNNELMADVHFVVGQPGRTQRLPGHRVRISSPSRITLAGRKWTNKQSASPAQCCSYHISRKIIFLVASSDGTKILCAPLSLPHHVSFRDSPQLFM